MKLKGPCVPAKLIKDESDEVLPFHLLFSTGYVEKLFLPDYDLTRLNGNVVQIMAILSCGKRASYIVFTRTDKSREVHERVGVLTLVSGEARKAWALEGEERILSIV